MPNGVAALQTGDLYPTYYNSVIPTIEMQLAKAGYRLANWLNQIVAANNFKKRDGDESRVMKSRMIALPDRKPSSAYLAREALFGGGCGCDEEAHKHR